MAKKGRKLETRTVLIVFFIILIIAAGYIVVTNMPAEEEFLTPEEILTNKDTYLNGQTITVKGYYIFEGGYPAVVSVLTTATGRASLTLNFDNLVGNETDILRTEAKFKFTGVLTLDENDPTGLGVVFVVEKIEVV
ncbi:MAG: hypothetical protein KAW45_03485 [Thermoplasmatales archaeon]|nr:hypothetical protein [Thermoplasmatales archaeon]